MTEPVEPHDRTEGPAAPAAPAVRAGGPAAPAPSRAPITRRLGAHCPAALRRLGGRLPSLTRLAWILWMLVVVGVTARVLVHILRKGDHEVYRVFLEAARSWTLGENTYDPAERYRYPPIATVSFVGLRALGEVTGAVLWRWLNIACYLAAVVWALRRRFPAALSPRGRAVTLLLMVLPSLTSLSNGQANGVVAGGLIAAAVALARHRQRLASLLVVAPVAYKVYPVAFAMVAGALHPRRFLPWFLLWLLLCAALPFLFADPDYVAGQYRALYDLLAVEDRTGDPNDAYRDVRLVLFHLGMPIDDRVYMLLQAVTGGGIAVLCLLGQRAGWSARRVAAYLLALTVCWMLVFGVSTEKATYILSTPILCWLLARADERGDRRWFWFLLLVYLCYLLPIFVPGSMRRGPLARSILPAATVVLMAVLAARGVVDLVRYRRRRARRRR